MVRRWACAAVGAILLTGCRSPESRPIRVSVNSWVGFGPLFVAQRQGLFARNGIAVEIVKLEDASDRRAALVSGRVDILGSTLDDLAVTADAGADPIAFACADMSNGGDGILGAGQVRDLAALATANIAVQVGFVNHFFLLYVLDANGIPVDSLRLNSMTPDDAGAAFMAGSIDAAVTWEPHLSSAIKARKEAVVLARSDQYPEAILDLFVAKRDWYVRNRTSAAAFRRSWDEALALLKADSVRAYADIAAGTGLPTSEVGVLLGGAALLSSSDCNARIAPMAAALSEKVVRLWSKAGYLRSKVDLSSSIMVSDSQ